METETMGRVVVEAKIESLRDIWDVERGLLPADQARSVTVSDALVDTGASSLSLPTRLIQQLGLRQTSSKRVTSTTGPTTANKYDAVRLTIQDRECTIVVMEVPDTVPVLIGQIPLEMLDFVVDMKNHKITGNPAHGGEYMYEQY
jgi:clan AA aspartic protease